MRLTFLVCRLLAQEVTTGSSDKLKEVLINLCAISVKLCVSVVDSGRRDLTTESQSSTEDARRKQHEQIVCR